MHLVTFALVLTLLAGALGADAQPPEKVVRIGYLSLQREDGDRSWVAAFRQGLQELGYVEGGNVAIEQCHAAGRAERLPGLASELVGSSSMSSWCTDCGRSAPLGGNLLEPSLSSSPWTLIR